MRPPLAPVTESCRKHPSLGPWCFQWAEEQHPPWLMNGRNAILWSSTPGISSGSYTRTVTCKEDAGIYQDMGALQILEIWVFLKQAKTACYWLTLPAYWISGGKTSPPQTLTEWSARTPLKYGYEIRNPKMAMVSKGGHPSRACHYPSIPQISVHAQNISLEGNHKGTDWFGWTPDTKVTKPLLLFSLSAYMDLNLTDLGFLENLLMGR